MIFIGIDPGVHGGIAFLEEQKLDVYPMPIIGDKEYDLQEIKNLLVSFCGKKAVFGVIERQHCMPGEGLPRTFKTGFGFGMLFGLFTGLEFPFHITSAKEWQGKIFRGLPLKQDTKVSSAIIAQRLYPTVNFRKSDRARVIADGMTDASCIATYAQRFYGQKLEPERTCVHKVLANNPEVCITCGEMV